MKQGEKITIIWDEHEPPKNYIWCHDGQAYQYNGQEWVESEYPVADLQWGHSNKREMVFDSNTIPPDNMIWNKDGDILVNKGEDNWEDIIPGEKISSWLIVDHTNFAEARHNQLEDYYNNYPSEAEHDGETWPPYNAAMFPWFVVNYEFDGDTTIHIYEKNKEVFRWKPSALVTKEDQTLIARTYGIVGVPGDMNMTEYTETVEGNSNRLDPNNFKIYLTKE